MITRLITIRGHSYSEKSSYACIDSAARYDIEVHPWWAVTPDSVVDIMNYHGLSWTWANMNTQKTICPHTGLHHFPYTARDVRTKMACSMSHYLLWLECADSDDEMLILEHDARFQRELPDIDFYGACQINDPRGGGYRGAWHSDQMAQRGTTGTHALTRKRDSGSLIPDGFSGGSAYLIKPHAAQQFLDAVARLGLWPNDATICLQLFPWLQEYYPFITWIDQQESTSTA